MSESIEVFIEIPSGSRNKYEFDHERGVIRLDRVLFSSVHYPADYGFVPDTLEPDGDPLDVLVLVHEPTFPGCLIDARPLGCLVMSDEKGEDHKVLAVPVKDPRFDEYRSLSDVPAHWKAEIENFFSTYKQLEDKETEIQGWQDLEYALKVIEQARVRVTEAGAPAH